MAVYLYRDARRADARATMGDARRRAGGGVGGDRARGRVTRFRERYDAGAVPARVAHAGSGNGIAWRVDPSALDAATYLPLFVEGMRETEHPYRLLAVRGATELARACGESELLKALPRAVLPLKAALDSRNFAVAAVALEFVRELAERSPAVGEALVPYYRQLLPALNGHKNVRDVFVSLVNLSDSRSWRERPRASATSADEPSSDAFNADERIIGRGRSKRAIASLTLRALRALERSGGVDALVNIKFHVPTYRSVA